MPLAIDLMSAARSCIESYLSSGRLARQRPTSRPSDAGVFGATMLSGAGCSSMIAVIVWMTVSRWNARFPDSIS